MHPPYRGMENLIHWKFGNPRNDSMKSLEILETLVLEFSGFPIHIGKFPGIPKSYADIGYRGILFKRVKSGIPNSSLESPGIPGIPKSYADIGYRGILFKRVKKSGIPQFLYRKSWNSRACQVKVLEFQTMLSEQKSGIPNSSIGGCKIIWNSPMVKHTRLMKRLSCSTTYLLPMPRLLIVGKVLTCMRKPVLFSPTWTFDQKRFENISKSLQPMALMVFLPLCLRTCTCKAIPDLFWHQDGAIW